MTGIIPPFPLSGGWLYTFFTLVGYLDIASYSGKQYPFVLPLFSLIKRLFVLERSLNPKKIARQWRAIYFSFKPQGGYA